MARMVGLLASVAAVLWLSWIEFDMAAVIWAIVAAIALEFFKDPA